MTERAWPAEIMLSSMARFPSVSIKEIAAIIERPLDKTVESLQVLVRRGLAQRNQDGRYRLTEAGLFAANNGTTVRTGAAGQPRNVRVENRSLRARAWQALRMEGGKSTLPNILTLLASDQGEASDTNLLKYFSALKRVGILARLYRRARGIAPTSNGFVVWVIIRDVGPKAPIWQSTKNQVFDPNTDTIIPLPPKGATP